MEITGKLKYVLPSEKIETKNGTKYLLPFVIETADRYPKSICFQFWNKEDTTFGVTIGSEIKVSFDLQSKEGNNGKWYTNATAYKYEVIKEAKPEAEKNYNELPEDFNNGKLN